MVSLDPPEKNRAFAESLEANFPVLSDPSGEVARAYGVFDDERGFARRWTFFIEPGGTIRHVQKDVNVLTAGEDVARELERLGFPRR